MDVKTATTHKTNMFHWIWNESTKVKSMLIRQTVNNPNMRVRNNPMPWLWNSVFKACRKRVAKHFSLRRMLRNLKVQQGWVSSLSSSFKYHPTFSNCFFLFLTQKLTTNDQEVHYKDGAVRKTKRHEATTKLWCSITSIDSKMST